MGKKDSGGGTPATVALTRAGIAFTLRAYDHDPAAESYGLEAATALGVAPERVLKTLLVSVDGNLVVGVVPVSGQLDLKAIAAPVLSHRILLSPEAQMRGVTSEDVLAGVMEKVPVPAPRG